MYPYHICQGAEYHHANGKGTGGGNLHETEHPSLHGSRNLFLDGDRDRGVVTGGCDSNHQIACQVKQEYRSHSKACHQHTVQPSGDVYKRQVCGYLLDQQEYAQVEEICSRAAGIDRFAEDFYYYMIYAVYKQGNQKKALEQYKSTTELFYRERLITPSDRFKELYEIISDRQQEIITDLDVIQASLDCPGTIEEQREHGAYQCEYAVFKRLVQLERRGVERSGDSVYLCLLTVGDRRGRTLKPEIQARAMERLKGVINHSLRSSDAFSRYSVSQYIILLPSVTYENGEQVMRRIMSAFNKAYVRKDVAVTYSLNLILPKEDTIEA